jgi:undecaprenyl-diphosphatase
MPKKPPAFIEKASLHRMESQLDGIKSGAHQRDSQLVTPKNLDCISMLARADVGFVHLCVRSLRWPVLKRLAVAVSWLGNGWIYAGIAIAIAVAMGAEAFGIIWRSSASVAILHSLYRPLKTWLSRPRPFSILPELQPLLPALDEYSCPSGHTMTLTAVLITLPVVSFSAILALVCVWTMMAWARVAVGHHYPSDVLAGSALAMLVAYPISKM